MATTITTKQLSKALASITADQAAHAARREVTRIEIQDSRIRAINAVGQYLAQQAKAQTRLH